MCIKREWPLGFAACLSKKALDYGILPLWGVSRNTNVSRTNIIVQAIFLHYINNEPLHIPHSLPASLPTGESAVHILPLSNGEGHSRRRRLGEGLLIYLPMRLRRTMMFVPGNNPGMMQDAYIYGPDSIMLDLEDSVTMAEKDTARLLVYNALKSVDYGQTEMVVRINPLSTPYGRKDIEAVVKAGVDVIRMPKTETAEEVVDVEREIEKVEREIGCLGRTKIMAAIESTLGVVNAYAIATASKRMMGIALGAEDYCANLKAQRSPEGMELLLARQTIVVAARAAGIDALDTVYSNLNDMEAFRREVELIHQLGFDGKSIINPRQIEIINEVFTPTQKAIDKALTVIAAIREAERKGSGVIAVNGKMVDRPVVIRAQRVIDLALASGVIKEEDIA